MFPGLSLPDQDWQPSAEKDQFMRSVEDMMADLEGMAKKKKPVEAVNTEVMQTIILQGVSEVGLVHLVVAGAVVQEAVEKTGMEIEGMGMLEEANQTIELSCTRFTTARCRI